MSLRLIQHRMPPSWDGQSVKWDAWHAPMPMFICPPPPMYACEQCGSVEDPLMSTGLVDLLPGETAETTREKTGRWGRTVHVPVTIPAYPLRSLTASRCPDCMHTTVHDLRTGENWELGPEDYTDAGSVPPVVKQWTGGLFDLLDES